MNQIRPAIFYGWWVVVATFFINLFVIGVIHFGFTAFFQPIASEFGWSYTQVSLATSLRGMEAGILSPVAGLAVDRFGARKLVFGGSIIMALGLVLFSRVTSIGMFYGAFLLIVLGMSGCTGVILTATVSHWFRSRVSLAMGIAACGVATGGLMIPLATSLIDSYGWRTTILTLGLGISGITLLLSLLLRNKPEQYGYQPYGAAASLKTAGQAAALDVEPVSRSRIGPRQVLANRTFWRMALAFVPCFLVVNAVTTHIMPYLGSVGIPRTSSSLLAGVVPLVTIVGRLGFGWVGDRFDLRRLATITFFMLIIGLFLFTFVAAGHMWLALPFIIFFSIGYGGNAIILPVLVRRYFGDRSFGTFLGFMMGVCALGQILGSPLAGWVFDTWGNYQGAWLGCAVLLIVATILMATMPPVAAGARPSVMSETELSR